MTPTKPILGYWAQRGLGHQARLLLTYLGVDFEDRRYSRGPDGSGQEWFETKHSLELDFPNLPYFIDGPIKLTQSLAILRYLGVKYGLAGSSLPETTRINLLEQQVADLQSTFYQLIIRPNYDDLSYDYLEILETVSLKQLADFLSTSPFVSGTGSISYADFWLYEYLVKIRAFAGEVFGKFPNLVRFVERIESLPKVKEYIEAQEPLVFSGPKYAWNVKY